MGSPRPVRAGTAADDSDWEPSDGEEGDSPPRTRSGSPSSGGDAGGAEASDGAKRKPRPRRTRAATDGEGCGVFSRTRGRRSRSTSGGADGAGPPADDERAASDTRDRSQAMKRTRQPKKTNISINEEHFKCRFSARRICSLVPQLSNQQKEWVIDAGFGALLSMHEFSVPIKLVKWMMKRVDPLLSEFRYKNRVIVFNRDLICKILGLENNARAVRISGDSDEVMKLKELYRDGDRAKIGRCISIATESKDRETFMRSFALLALGSVYNPGTGNDVSLKYLNSLENVELISTFDWAGHILSELMDEVKKYQKFSPERLEKDHQIGSCLIILAIAYMDHLDLPSDRGHQINYSLPRICHVRNADFNFVMAVDKNKLSLGNSFGRLPFRDFSLTPYAPAPAPAPSPAAAPAPAPAPATGFAGHSHGLEASEEVPIVSSLDEWLKQPAQIDIQEIPAEYQHVAAHFSKVMDEDVREIAAAVSKSFNDQISARLRQRQGEMLAKMAELASRARTSVDGAGPSATDGDVGKTSASVAAEGGTSKSTTGAPVRDTSKSGTCAAEGGASKSASAGAEGGTSNVNTSTSGASSPGQKKSNDSSLFDDLPSFDLLNSDGIDDDCSTPPEITCKALTIVQDREANKPGSSTNDKKNRRKRAAINLNQGKKLKKLKLDEETKSVYEKFISKRVLKKPVTKEEILEAPVFVKIGGFHVCYEEFYKSFKPKGLINNEVMTIWTNQFNIEEAELRVKDNNVVKKYAFSAVLTDKLIIAPDKFIDDSCNRMLTMLDKTWDFSKMDLLFFPIVQERHWVLVCINMFLQQISWFNPLNASQDTICFVCAQNLVTNFSRACLNSNVLKKDVSQFVWNYPKDYPQQDNLYDCGLYTMLYIECWNGKKTETSLQPHMMGDYRKVSAAVLLLSSSNEVKLSEFVEKHCKNK